MNEQSERDIQIEILAELKRLNAAIARRERSSVELAENAKGAVQLTVKTYVDSPPIDEACIEAVSAFQTLKQEVERGQMNQWRETITALQTAAD